MNKSYYAVIPANVRYDKNLCPNAKLLYGEITALCNEKGFCWASNQYFAELYSKTEETISRWINQLKQYNYIKIKYKKRGFEIIERKIFLSIDKKVNRSIDEKINRSIDKKVKENTTINNTVNITFTGNFFEVLETDHQRYQGLYPRQNLMQQYMLMDSWLHDNPGKRYKNYKRFVGGWLSRQFKDIKQPQYKKFDKGPIY